MYVPFPQVWWEPLPVDLQSDDCYEQFYFRVSSSSGLVTSWAGRKFIQGSGLILWSCSVVLAVQAPSVEELLLGINASVSDSDQG
jgi:hypothetical protein